MTLQRNNLLQAGRRRAAAFTLVEVMVAAAILALALVGLLNTVGSANRGAMDTYYQALGNSLAREPLEVLRPFGYEWLAEYAGHPLAQYPLGWSDVPVSRSDVLVYPNDAAGFRRHLAIEPVTNGTARAMRIRVTVAPADRSRIVAWVRRDDFVLETLVFARDNP